MTEDIESPREAPPASRYVPLGVWLIVILVLLFIPFKITSLGYLPTDDALRHAAKAVSGKSWPQILVVGENYKIDHNFGWELLLRQIHSWTNWDAENLVVFSVVGLFLVVAMTGLLWMKRPEAWLGTLLLLSTIGIFVSTSMFGRPYLLTLAALMTILFAWHNSGSRPPGWATVAGLSALIAISVFVHGAWYFWALPVAAFFCAREYRWGAALILAWIFGTVLGASLTGHPIIYLSQALALAFKISGLHRLTRTLADELQPTAGNPFVPFLVALLIAARQLANLKARPVTSNPAFWLVCIGWVLGFNAERWWDDWGFPALIVLVACELQLLAAERLPYDSIRRLFLTGGLAVATFLALTGDVGGRWTSNVTTEYVKADDAQLKDWLPEEGGIIYSADMTFFYQTFFKNPRAPWRYMLGFEPTLMPDEDFDIYNRIMWNFGDARSYEPWVKKMRPGDRLAIRSPGGNPPQIPELDWHYAVSSIWIGKLPATNSPAK